MLVMIPYFGRAISHKGAISPAWFIPISQTAAVCSCVVARTVSGTPMWLFRFPRVAETRYFWESTAAVRSFVLVLPFDPVIPTTGMTSCLRHQQARRCSASKVSGTTTTAVLGGALPSQYCTIATEAPPSSALEAKRSPLKFSPRRAKNAQPCRSLRVSVETPALTTTSPDPAARGMPRMSASCWAEIGFIACLKWPEHDRAVPCWHVCDRRNRPHDPQIVGLFRGPCQR